ncbi:hypothetical protein BLOT_009784 [Blomia tropicalis]|nr:hypothetical protein BLOT_009784 [Blomia tropicalis]
MSDHNVLITDQESIDILLVRMTQNVLSDNRRLKLPVYRSMRFCDEDMPEFTSDMFPFTFDMIGNYTIAKMFAFKHDQQSNLVESFGVLWNPSWLWFDDTQSMNELKKAYWTHVKHNTPLVDMCPLDDGKQHNVRRVISHEFIYNAEKKKSEPVYLVEWAPEIVTLESYQDPDYVEYAAIIKQYVADNHINQFDTASRNLWFPTR